jgi:hypothetical protein
MDIKKTAALFLAAEIIDSYGIDVFNEVAQELVEMDNQIKDEDINQLLVERVAMYIRLNQEALETANQLP